MRGKLAITLLVALASAVAPVAAQSPLIRRGQGIAEQLCARCHSVATAGESPMAAAPPFRALPQRYPVEHLAEALAEGIVTGHPAMPQFKFGPAEIDALLSFIDSLAAPGERK